MPHSSTSTAAAPTMNEKRTETNWSLLKVYLENDKVSFSDLELICAVCRDPMSVLPDGHGHREEDDVNSHRAMILPCGHIFGNSCIKTAFSDGSDLRPVCFMCRADLVHPGCQHIHLGQQMPCSKKYLSQFPTNGFIHSWCSHDCFLTLVNGPMSRSTPKVFSDLLGRLLDYYRELQRLREPLDLSNSARGRE
jgi:hypothetical protein